VVRVVHHFLAAVEVAQDLAGMVVLVVPVALVVMDMLTH
jgi:hypothetical protein